MRERHEADGVVNELVALPMDGSAEPRVIEDGRDFYAGPRLSPDGTKLTWMTWDLPWMPWDGSEVWVADVAADASLSGARKVAGVEGEESILQPEWSPAGELHFVSDRTDWWNLYRERDGRIEPLCAMRGRVRVAAVGLRRARPTRSSATAGSPASTTQPGASTWRPWTRRPAS